MNTKITLTNPTDDELGAAVAEYVAGWKRYPACGNMGEYWDNASGQIELDGPLFATSADAVMPLLEKAGAWAMDWCPIISNRSLAYKVWVRTKGIEALGPTFHRAACIALLRANGVECMTWTSG